MDEGWILTGRVVERVVPPWPRWPYLHVNIGVSARLRPRDAGFNRGEDAGWLVGHEIKVIDIDSEQDCVFVSRRAVLEK